MGWRKDQLLRLFQNSRDLSSFARRPRLPACPPARRSKTGPQLVPAPPGEKAKRIVMSAGFEPARVAPLAPEASALDHSARTPVDSYMFDRGHIRHCLPGLTANVEFSSDSVGASIEGHMLHNLPMGIMRKKRRFVTSTGILV
jgi:hypothetical protein